MLLDAIDESGLCGVSSYLQGYYQESGRAGRDGEAAECVLMMAPKDYPRLIQLLRKGGRTSKTKFQAGMELIQHVSSPSLLA